MNAPKLNPSSSRKRRRARPLSKLDNGTEQVLAGFPEFQRLRLRKLIGKYERGAAAQFEIKELGEAGIIKQGSGSSGKPDKVSSLTELAAHLNHHFDGRLSIQISKQQINHWKKGRGLSKGTPPPPPAVNFYYMLEEWQAWVEKHIASRSPALANGNGHAGEISIFDKAMVAEAQRKIDDGATAAIDRGIKERQYARIEISISLMRGIGAVLNQTISVQAEKASMERLGKVADGFKLDDGQKQELRQGISEACQATADALRSMLAAEIRKAGERLLSEAGAKA